MPDLDGAVDLLNAHARLAAACGAVGVPGGALASALQAADGRRIGPVRLETDARLDRLALVQEVATDTASQPAPA